MKYFIKKILKDQKIINFRNLINFKPVKINTDNLVKNFSVSDSFPWRTDSNYSTIFRFKDLLGFYYNDTKRIVD